MSASATAAALRVLTSPLVRLWRLWLRTPLRARQILAGLCIWDFVRYLQFRRKLHLANKFRAPVYPNSSETHMVDLRRHVIRVLRDEPDPVRSIRGMFCNRPVSEIPRGAVIAALRFYISMREVFSLSHARPCVHTYIHTRTHHLFVCLELYLARRSGGSRQGFVVVGEESARACKSKH